MPQPHSSSSDIKRIVKWVPNACLALTGFLVGRALSLAVRHKVLYFPFVSESLGMIPFSLGWKLRQSIYSELLPKVGKDVVLHFGVTIEDERSTFGSDIWVSRGAFLDFVSIGDSVLIGPQAVLLAGGRQHRFDQIDIPIKSQGNPPKEPIIIGNGAWIGAHATVMANIGEGAIVGAGAVVCKEVRALEVVAGNPAKTLRIRQSAINSTPTLYAEMN